MWNRNSFEKEGESPLSTSDSSVPDGGISQVYTGGLDMTDETKTKANTKASGNRKQNRNAKIQKAESSNESSQGIQQEQQQVVIPSHPNPMDYMSKKEEVDITPYVSNVDGPVYAISGLPEEFIATLFAWVSRSSKSFKEHLRTALQDQDVRGNLDSFKTLDDKAKAFHEKWTVGYGHSSVAEHATAHVGIEGISRLASAELELANQFLSITEYSQRYQKPHRGGWHNPFGEDKLDLQESVECFYNKAFDAFEKLIEGVHKHLMKTQVFPYFKETNAEFHKKEAEMMKLAFEDARYVLPLAMHTQMGMTANGRAWRDALAMLGNSKHAESVQLADDIRTEVTKVLPVLLKYAIPSQYQRNSKKRMNQWFDLKNTETAPAQTAQLLPVETEETTLNKIVALLNQEYSDLPYANALMLASRYTDRETKEKLIKDLLHEMAHFDVAPDVFKHISYQATVLVSEANWHQLLRHNRKTEFTFSNPSPHFGITMPPRIVEAGLQDLVKEIAQASQELYNILVEEGFDKEAEYVVLNAHRRQVFMSFSLWEAYHLINLRTSEEAQWDIRETFEDLFKQLYTVHPLLMSQAKRRL